MKTDSKVNKMLKRWKSKSSNNSFSLKIKMKIKKTWANIAREAFNLKFQINQNKAVNQLKKATLVNMVF